MNYSTEQKEIVLKLKDKYNIKINAVAGSGKTTTILYIAKTLPTCNILVLTYNAKLKFETRHKVEKLGLKNTEVHSYHSFCVKYYNPKAYTDTGINNLLKDNIDLKYKSEYSLIILDESQDIIPLYYQLICKIVSDTNKVKQLCLLGDVHQSIYDYNGADNRYLTFSDKLFNFKGCSNQWISLTLSETFRIPRLQCDFINNCVLNSTIIRSNKVINSKPRYIICDCFGLSSPSYYPIRELLYYLNQGYRAKDIFIIGPSLKNINSPIRQFENCIKLNLPELPVYVPLSDEEKLDESLLENKLVFSTIHQTKGLERKVILLFNFDYSYFKYYKQNTDPFKCSNELYVALTRSLEKLSIFHHFENNFLPFLTTRLLGEFCEIITDKSLKIKKNYTKNGSIKTSVTDLTKHLPFHVLDECFDLITKKQMNPINTLIKIQTKTKQKYGYENVSEITGIAIPAYFEYTLKNKIGFYEAINVKTNIDTVSTNKLLEYSNIWSSQKNGFIYKTQQIEDYNWLTKEHLELALKRLYKLDISKEATFEVEYEVEFLNRKIVGFVDCIDRNNVYEFKCTSQFDKEHYIQLILYMYLIHQKTSMEFNYYLFNILSDELYLLTISETNLTKLLQIIIKYKYYPETKLSDTDFLSKNLSIKNLYSEPSTTKKNFNPNKPVCLV
jgi:hypothetical protein